MTTSVGRRFKLTIVQAQSLPKISSPYAVVWIDGRPTTVQKTDEDTVRETDPRWDFVADFKILETDVQLPGVNLVVQISCKRSMGEDGVVGEVRIPIKSLFDMGLNSERPVRYDVDRTPNGVLDISYSFGHPIAIPNLSVSGPLLPSPSPRPLGHGPQSYSGWGPFPNLSVSGPLLPSPSPRPLGHGPQSYSGWGPFPNPIPPTVRPTRVQEMLATAMSAMHVADEANRVFFHGGLNVGQTSHYAYDHHNHGVHANHPHSFGDSYNQDFDYSDDWTNDDYADYSDDWTNDDYSDSSTWW